VVGGDTDHGCLPWLVSPPASDNLKWTHLNCILYSLNQNQ
jgi:hypothetical protein